MLKNGYWSCIGTDSLSVILTGIVVVFAMLLVLIIAIKLISVLVAGIESLGKGKKEKKAAQKEAKPEAKKAAPAAAAAPAEKGTPGSVIAAISAAVAMMLGHGNFKIKGIRKANSDKPRRNAWRTAGMQDNTRPF